MKKEYTLQDMKRELFQNPTVKKLYDKELVQLRIAHQIAELREKHHLTQKELADRLGTKQQVISRIEKDNYQPSLSTLEKIARVFDREIQISFIAPKRTHT